MVYRPPVPLEVHPAGRLFRTRAPPAWPGRAGVGQPLRGILGVEREGGILARTTEVRRPAVPGRVLRGRGDAHALPIPSVAGFTGVSTPGRTPRWRPVSPVAGNPHAPGLPSCPVAPSRRVAPQAQSPPYLLFGGAPDVFFLAE